MNVTSDALFKVISTPPVLNSNTIYSTVMQPKTGYYHTIVWDPPIASLGPERGFEVSQVAESALALLLNVGVRLPIQMFPLETI